MNILSYITVKSNQGERLQRVIEVFSPKEKIETCRSIVTLREKLQQPFKHLDVAVFFPSDENELSDLLSLRDLLRDMRIILVLPDRTRGIVAMGHMLRPRLISYGDSDFFEVAAVLGRMLEKWDVAYQMDERRHQ